MSKQNQPKEADRQNDRQWEDLWEDIRAWERKVKAELETHERNQQIPEWGTFG